MELQFRLSECVDSRLDELERWRAGWREGRPPPLARDIGMQRSVVMLTSVWSVTAGNSAAKLPPTLQNTYAAFYELIAVAQRVMDTERELWSDMRRISYLDAPD